MIPKIIHYCWLGNNPIPPNQVECMNSWQKYCPNVKIVRWDFAKFDIKSVPLVKEAVEANKLAFAADYIRQYALYYEGGVYLDTDVMLYDDIFKYLDADYVSAVEYHPKKSDRESNIGFLDNDGIRTSDRIKVYGIGILSAILASVPKHPLVKKCMDFYEQKSLNDILINHLTAPTVIAYNAEEYGFKYKNAEQRLENSIHLYTPQFFSHFDQYNKHSVAVHYCAGSWVKKDFFRKCLDIIKSNKVTFSFYTFLKRKGII